MTEANIGAGIHLQRSGDGIGGSYATVGQVVDLSAPGISKDTTDATHSESPERFKEFKSAFKDGGEASVEVFFNPAAPAVTLMLGDVAGDQNGFYKVVFPDTTEWEFEAIATGFEPSTPIDDNMTGTFTMKLTGKPAFLN
ncbi:MAG: phage tail tube protein [Pseudoruegeria sp.]